jgi:hypothetical protein
MNVEAAEEQTLIYGQAHMSAALAAKKCMDGGRHAVGLGLRKNQDRN